MGDDLKAEKTGTTPIDVHSDAKTCSLKPELETNKWGTTEPIFRRIPFIGKRFRRDVSDDVVTRQVDKQGPQ